MSYEEFLALVKRMRWAQKSYFRAGHGTREKQNWLSEAKKLEKQVDDELTRSGQGKLFG